MIASVGHSSCVKLLIDAGASLTARDSGGDTALHAAAAWSSGETVKLLLESGIGIGDRNTDNEFMALSMAAEWGAWGTLEAILLHRDHREYFVEEPERHPLLVDRGATIDKSESPGHRWLRTPMHIAIYFNEPEIVKYLLQQGANPNIYDLDGWPAISTAAERGYTDMVGWLAEAKADLEVTYKDQNLTTLHVAVSYPETVRVLIQHGADIGKISTDSRTPLDAAIFQNKPETVRVLLEEPKTKPDLSLSNTQKELRGAVIAGFTEVVGALLEAGADVNIVDEENQSLLCLAMKYSQEADIVRTILEYNPDLEISDHKQNTALHCITPVTSLEAVRRVVNAGGRLDAGLECQWDHTADRRYQSWA
ncbi:hypothetical protein FDECE_303 [Fusarium decemcellulare]|nr:hypothetical protein FDECE_303 [Fusarium decemcellulare]